jgi:hypothetical protein
LREEVRAEGRHGMCSYCRATDIGIRLSDLGDRIHEVLEAQFHLTPSEPDGVDYIFAKEEGYWNRPGDPVTQVIADIAGLDEEIAENIREYLSNQHGYFAVKDGEEDLYGDDAQYEEDGPDDLHFQDTWEASDNSFDRGPGSSIHTPRSILLTFSAT